MVAVLDHWWLVLPGIVVFAFVAAPMVDGRPTRPEPTRKLSTDVRPRERLRNYRIICHACNGSGRFPGTPSQTRCGRCSGKGYSLGVRSE